MSLNRNSIGQVVLEPEWKSFEKAVAEFCKRLAPDAKVERDTFTPDADTGRPRQRDVWITATIGGFFPVTALISCKHYKRKLNQQDLDAFIGEWRSSKANVGVIYSKSGFSAPAIEKAQAAGVNCCRLYANEPPDIPAALILQFYYWMPILEVAVIEGLEGKTDLKWRDLYRYSDEDGSLLDQMNSACSVAAERTKQALARGEARPNSVSVVHLGFDEQEDTPTFVVRVAHRWRLFKARGSHHAVIGSYSQTHANFTGTVSSPSIDTLSEEPGVGWEEVPVAEHVLQQSAVHMIAVRGASRETLLDGLGPCPVVTPQSRARTTKGDT